MRDFAALWATQQQGCCLSWELWASSEWMHAGHGGESQSLGWWGNAAYLPIQVWKHGTRPSGIEVLPPPGGGAAQEGTAYGSPALRVIRSLFRRGRVILTPTRISLEMKKAEKKQCLLNTLLKCTNRGVPGWLRWLGVCLWLRS